MTAASHALSAGIILKTIPDPAIAFPLAFVSHFLLDLVPHWDIITDQNHNGSSQTLVNQKNHSNLVSFAAFDVLAGWGLTFWLFKDLNPLLLFITILIAQLPDWLEMPYFFWGLNFRPSILVKKIQRRVHSRLSLPWGLVTQLAILIPLLWWTLR